MSIDLSITKNQAGNDIYELIKKLFPICRCITGNGVRESLKIIKEVISELEIHEVPSGAQVFDWIVPKEWNIRDAFIKNSKGEKIVDFKKSNLNVVHYSVPIHKNISLKELKDHLYTLPDQPDLVPYKTSFYNEVWGFCMPHNKYLKLEEDEYEVYIDSTLEEGSLTYGELFLKGNSEKEILFSSYICHPSMCNDNLSGVCLLAFVAKNLLNLKTKYSYRFLFMPETIGAITWLSLNENKLSNIQCGLIATCLGDSGPSTYKKTKAGNALIDKAVEKVLFDCGQPFEVVDFSPIGSDERQFSSPGFNIPVGNLTRTPYCEFPEYHTSADNLDFVDPDSLQNTYEKYMKTIFVCEKNDTYLNLNPKGEPQLGRRGLCRTLGGLPRNDSIQSAIVWVLNLSDGTHSLLDIAIRSKLRFEDVLQAAYSLMNANLIKKLD